MSKIRRKLRASNIQREMFLIGSVAIMLLLMAACGPSSAPDGEAVDGETPTEMPATVETQESADDDAYPPPAADVSEEVPKAEEAYPVEPPPPPPPTPTLAPESYPPPAEVFEEPRFRIDTPLESGSTTVSGQAPPDLPLAVVDVTYGGIVMGAGVSDADGRFVIGVQPLTGGNRIGITFAELQSGKTLVQMSQEYYPHRGEGFINIPNVGIYFDSALVEP